MDEVSFDGAEFIIEPTFEDARFATDPTLEDAEFLTNIDASVEERYRQWQLVLVHPESLDNADLTVPASAIEPEFSVPVSLTHLAEEVPGKTKAFVDTLGELKSEDWHHVIDDALPIARTSATHLDDPTSGWLVFGFELDGPETEPAEFLQTVQVAGVYYRDEEKFQFTHLSPTLTDLDYLVPVPVTDATFEAGADVATSSEIRKAMIRHERFRLREYLEDSYPEENSFGVHHALVPVLVGASES